MARFDKRFRKNLPNKIARHFDKYVEFTHPVTFDPIADIYRHRFDDKQWDALQTLLSCDVGKDILGSSGNLELLMDGYGRSRYEQDALRFYLRGAPHYPSISVAFDDLPVDSRNKIREWMKVAVSYKKLRGELFDRVWALLDWGWDPNARYDDYNSRWVGGPTTGQGCNTVGQVKRIWPELLAFFPHDEIATARNAQQKSRLPQFIKYNDINLTPKQFMAREQLFHGECQTEPYTEDEMRYERRKLAAINHILVQMSLMKEVPNVDNYPEISLANSH